MNWIKSVTKIYFHQLLHPKWRLQASNYNRIPAFSFSILRNQDNVSHWADGVTWSGLTAACDTRGRKQLREDVQGGNCTLVLWVDVRFCSENREITCILGERPVSQGLWMMLIMPLQTLRVLQEWLTNYWMLLDRNYHAHNHSVTCTCKY